MPEFKILNHVIDFMESKGSTYKGVKLSIDQKLVDEINTNNQSDYTLEELKKATDKCLAHEWIKNTTLNNKYDFLSITPKGIGAARSKQKTDQLKLSRNSLKRVSDYIDDHKGLFVVLGFLLAIATFGLKIFGE